MSVAPVVEALRVPHWIKNTFVFAPLVFGLRFTDAHALTRVVWEFLAFSLAASAIYLVNDVVDREKDRKNPRTRNRPIARGAVRPSEAIGLALALAAAAVLLALAAGPLWPLVLYIVLGNAYSVVLKKLVLLDVISIAGLYLLRLVAGALAAQLPPSPWLMACGSLLALLLALGKRLERQDGHYSPDVLRSGLRWLLGATAVAYALYSLQPTTWRTFTPWFVVTNAPVLAGLRQYLRATAKGYADPTEALFRDFRLKLYLAIWVALVVVMAFHALSSRGG